MSENSDPWDWLITASVIHRCAERIEYGSDPTDDNWRFFPLYRMLIGLVTENLIKGILVARAGQFEKQHANHDLGKLIDEINNELEFCKKERELLKDLEKYVLWAGRYPIPKNPKDDIGDAHRVDRKIQKLEKKLIRKLAKHLHQKIKDKASENEDWMKGDRLLAQSANED